MCYLFTYFFVFLNYSYFMMPTLEISVHLCVLMYLSSVILHMLILLFAFVSKLCLMVMYIFFTK